MARLLLGLALLFAAFPVANGTAQEADHELAIVVSTHEVVIRSCPEPGCAGIDLLRLGDTVHVTGPIEDGYYPVESAGRAGYVWSLFLATPSNGTPVLHEGVAGCNRIALIFNLGQGSFDDPFSWDMLNYLKSESIPATMFIRAWWAAYYPAWAYDFDQSGFVVGIHGENDFSLQNQTPDEAMAMLLDAQATLYEAIGHNGDPVFTPADPDLDAETLSMVALAGYLPVIAGVSARDGQQDDNSSETVAANILDGAYDGAIIELHLDSQTGVASTAAALPGVVATLRDAGYTFVTIPDMAQPCPSN